MCDLTDCPFEGVMIRKWDDVLWQFIPQDDRHRIEGKLVVICSRMKLPIEKRGRVVNESHGMLDI